MIRFLVAIAVLVLSAFTVPVPAAADYKWMLPAWAPKPLVPTDNPMSEAKVVLGRRLFCEKRLSVTGVFGRVFAGLIEEYEGLHRRV
jgi:cytochrome c peroxidase